MRTCTWVVAFCIERSFSFCSMAEADDFVLPKRRRGRKKAAKGNDPSTCVYPLHVSRVAPAGDVFKEADDLRRQPCTQDEVDKLHADLSRDMYVLTTPHLFSHTATATHLKSRIQCSQPPKVAPSQLQLIT